MRKKIYWPLVVVLLVGGVLRFVGVYPGHNPYHPDEGKAGYISARKMFLEGRLDPLDYNYPALVPLTELAVFGGVVYPLVWVKTLVVDPDLVTSGGKLVTVLRSIIENQEDLGLLYWGRYITAFFGWLTLLVVYWVGKSVYKSRLAGVLGALVLAVNFRAVMNSHFDLPDTYNAFYLILAFGVMLQILRKPSRGWYLLSGVAMGMAFSAKLQFFSFVPFALLHAGTAWRGRKTWRGRVGVFFAPRAFIAVFALVLTAVVVNYFQLLEYDVVYGMMRYQGSKYGLGVKDFNLYSFSYLYHIVLTPPVFWAAVFDGVAGLYRRTLPVLSTLSVIAIFLYFFLYLTAGGYYTRNFVTIIPFFAVLAGGLGNELLRMRGGFVVAVLVMLVILIPSAGNVYAHVGSYSQDWSLTRMRHWLNSNLEDHVVVAVHPWDKYTLFSLPGIDVRRSLEFTSLEITGVYSASELRTEGADYALVGVDVLTDATSTWWMRNGELEFWEKPDEVSKNVFAALATRELFAHTLFAAVRPWQAPDNNYVFVKIPDEIEFEGEVVYRDGFGVEGEIGWRKVDGFGGGGVNLVFDREDGYGGEGSLKILKGHADYPVVRWVSPCFSVKSGHGYKVSAWVRAEKLVDKKNRDAFLRLDFYSDQPLEWDEKTQSDSVFISERYWGEGWVQLNVSGLAPKGAGWGSVSLQVPGSLSNDYWLDDVEVVESVEELGRSGDGFEYTLPDDILVPYSTGGH